MPGEPAHRGGPTRRDQTAPGQPRIIRLTPDDTDRYLAIRRGMLEESSWAFASSPEDDFGPGLVAERLRDPENVIVAAELEGRLVATAGVYRSTPRKARHLARVWGVYTSPSARGLGLGRRVVVEAIAIARGWDGVAGVCLSVSERTPAAVALYETLGFARWGVEPDATRIGGESACEIHMRLMLDPRASEA